MSLYNNCDVNVQGGSSTIIGDQNIHNHPSSSGFEQLQKQVAANALHNSGEVSDQPKCHPGTRVAILAHLIAWATALTYTYPIIWLHGPAGAGKSAIQRTIAQLLYERGLLLASFFFFRTAAGRNSSNNFIATIAYQVALSIPATRPHIERAIDRNPLIFSLSLWDQAQALLISPILVILNKPSFNTSHHPRIIIIDGLDECHDSNKQCEILEILCRVLQCLPTPLALLIASRPEHHIRGAFDLGDLNKYSSRLSLDDSYNPDADIKTFLVDQFSRIQQLHPFRAYLPKPWPTQEDIDKLVAKASGQFIYASTVDRFISSIRHNPAERLDILLGHLDAGKLKPFEQLDSLYSVIFHAIDAIDLAGALRVLGVALVISVLDASSSADWCHYSPRFVECLLGLQIGSVRHYLFDLESLLTIDEDHKNIRFFHASLPDYLFDKSRSGQFWLDSEIVYADIAQRCLLIISISEATALRVFLPFFFRHGTHLLSKAAPIPTLHEAIERFNPTNHVHDDIQTMVMYGIRRSKFLDAENFYCGQLALFARSVGKEFRSHFENAGTRFASIAAIALGPDFDCQRDLQAVGDIFPMSRSALSRNQFSNPYWRLAMDDLLQDPQGSFFVDEGQYTDIALHLVEYMSHKSFRDNRDHLQAIEKIFPIILAKSSIRSDLLECIKASWLRKVYRGVPVIQNAISKYISKSEDPINGAKFLHHAKRTHVSGVNQSLNQTPEGALSLKTQVVPREIEDTPNTPKTSVSGSKHCEDSGNDKSLLGSQFLNVISANEIPGLSIKDLNARRPLHSMSRTSQTSQNVTAGSLSTVGSGTLRAITPIQKANPIPQVQLTSIARATSSTRSRNPGIRTPLKRKSPALIQEPSTQDAPQPQDTESIANQNPEEPIEVGSSHNNITPTSMTGIQKLSKTSVALSSLKMVRAKKPAALNNKPKPSWKG